MNAGQILDAREAFKDDPRIDVRSSSPSWTSLHIKPLSELREKITNYLRHQFCDLPAELCEQLALAADELIGNSIEHGCGLDPKCYIDFTCVRTGTMLLFHVKDAGPGFSVEEMEHAAINNPPEQPLKHAYHRHDRGMRPGGFGILLVRQIADELIYSERGNEVIMVKYLDRAAS